MQAPLAEMAWIGSMAMAALLVVMIILLGDAVGAPLHG